eukprot:11211484-Alexandrium_andersonii.AAC.1
MRPGGLWRKGRAASEPAVARGGPWLRSCAPAGPGFPPGTAERAPRPRGSGRSRRRVFLEHPW